MAVLFSETWAGANGAAWPAAWQAQANQNGPATIQSNAGQLVAPASSNTAARQQTVNNLPAGDLDVTLLITVPNGQADFTIGIAWRADTGSDPGAPPGSRMFPANGQSLRLDTNGNLYLYRQNNNTLTVITASPTNVGASVGVGPRNLRLQQVGTTIRVKVWNQGAAEPAGWQLSATDAGAFTSAGRLSLAVAAGFGSTTAASQTVQFDTLTVSDVTTTPPPPPAGTRRNWSSLSAADRQAVINGFQQAKTSGVYDDLTRLHMQVMAVGGSGDWHQRPIFLPVHRWFITRIEAAMGVTMPYWDWAAQPTFPAGLGGNGTQSQNWRVTTGPFANWTSVVYNSTTGAFSTRPGIIRQFGSAAPDLPTTAQVNNALGQTVYDQAPWNTSPGGFRNILEGWVGGVNGPGIHNRVHEWVGGDMRLGTSPNDPVFWMHHANIDRIWGGWQNRRGLTNYAAPAGQGPNDPMPQTGGVTPAQMFTIPSYDQLP